MIDLHIHTKHSDGTDSVEELLIKAQESNLAYISITDHETCAAYNALNNIDIKKYYKGRIITGIELKASYKQKIIDILGYKIDIEKINKWLNNFYKDKTHAIIQTKYLKHFYNTFKEMNITLPKLEEIEWSPDNDWASLIIYKVIKSYPENQKKLPDDLWNKFENFKYNYIYNTNTKFYIDKSKDHPSVNECIDAIKNAGGLVFLPHIYKYEWVKDKETFINELLDNYHIDGIECYYSKFSNEQIEYLINLCDERKLYKSGGCDYHGKKTKDINLGIGKGNLNIPNDIIKSWCN